MVQSPSWEVNWFAASQEISRNPKVHYCSYERSPPFSILGQPNPVHIPTSHILEIHPNIIHPSTPRSPQWSPYVRFTHQDPIHPPLLTHTQLWIYHLWSILFWRFDAASRALSWWNRVDEEERSVFCDVIVSVTVMWTCAWLWMVSEIKLFEYPWFLDLTLLYFCLWSWMKREFYKRKVATWEELLANVLDAASHVKKWEN